METQNGFSSERNVMSTPPNLWLLYVKDPLASGDFYTKLLGQEPSTRFPSYVAFEFSNGLNLGLWSLEAKDFVSGGEGHRSELALMVESDAAVRDRFESWAASGVTIEQPLKEAVFGLTFVALDPDGHRIRVCTPD